MPNWCGNTLTVSGDPADLSIFLGALERDADGHVLLLKSLHPCPEELLAVTVGFGPHADADAEGAEARRAAYGHANWYDWALANWGTKWADTDTTGETPEPGLAILRFDTAWSPPIAGIAHVAEQFPSLDFTLSYIEEGMGFEGEAEWAGGVLVRDDYSDIVPDDEDDEDDDQA